MNIAIRDIISKPKLKLSIKRDIIILKNDKGSINNVIVLGAILSLTNIVEKKGRKNIVKFLDQNS